MWERDETREERTKRIKEFSVIVHVGKPCWKNYRRTDSELKISVVKCEANGTPLGASPQHLSR
jgi:hypothetical protein